MKRSTLTMPLFALVLVSCSTQHATSPTSPDGARSSAVSVQGRTSTPETSLESWRRDFLGQLRTRTTDDFIFHFETGDPAANAAPAGMFLREDLLQAVEHLLHGGGASFSAERVRFDLGGNAVVQPDPGAGDPRLHRVAHVPLRAIVRETGPGGVRERTVEGFALFHLVRGDGALIPNDLVQQGYKPDSTTWWLRGWEDETLPADARGHGLQRTTLGQLFVDYRN
jgi:hypothetical protein